jgi:hypothetical protein
MTQKLIECSKFKDVKIFEPSKGTQEEKSSSSEETHFLQNIYPCSSDSEDSEEDESDTESADTYISTNEGRKNSRGETPQRDSSFSDVDEIYKHAFLAERPDPEGYQEAIASLERNQWKEAMKEEMESLESNGTWKLVEAPKGRKIIQHREIDTEMRNTKPD